MGLYGLANFISQQRSTEVAIRKVFGSDIGQVVSLLLKNYSVWILISFTLASPLGYYIMKRWLESFSVKIGLGPGIFAGALLIAALLAVITISGNTNRTARANPADTLRHE